MLTFNLAGLPQRLNNIASPNDPVMSHDMKATCKPCI